ncbi:hypothetical protein FCM35_KLT17315 [Carex littledalei]|uniref:Uncharacterized protein n=1 Tax=Carex littledalei TaxID=544730 RepID=A0A833REP6_9POAL|nr:hypothetical protein FCM35_KLT17315 [Carex littledalei]
MVFNEKLQELVDCTNQKLADDLGDYRRKPIFRVTEKYIKIDKQAYTPLCLSIGPYHYPKGEGKEYILKDVIRFGCPLDDYYSKLISHEQEFRDYYEKIQPEISPDFLQILLLDSVFLLWLTNLISENEECNGPELTIDHYRDIFLVENQIPFDVLNKVFATAHGERQEQPFALLLVEGLKWYFDSLMIPMVAPDMDTDPVHLLHLVHRSLVPVKGRNISSDVRCNQNQQDQKFLRWHRAVEYHQAGVQFKKMDLQSPHTLLDIEFKNGVLSIPRFSIDELTQDFFRNLVTFELLTPDRGVRKYVTAYIIFMSQLLSTPGDVTLLYQKEIIDYQLGRANHVCELFQNLAQGLPGINKSYYEMSFGRKLEKHYSNRWNKWMAWLKHKHFKNPWLILALLAATLLLVCTILQTFFSVFCYAKPPH